MLLVTGVKMIEDKEFRDLFKIESSEHIQKIEDGLLRLEKEPDNQPVLEEVFREAAWASRYREHISQDRGHFRGCEKR